MPRSRSRSPIRHFNNSGGGRARNMLDSSSLEPIKFKKEGFGRNRGGRRSFHNYDDRDRRRPMNRQERRAPLQTRDYEETKKPMLILDDPSRVPRGAYFEHDRRETVPGGRGNFVGGQSNFRSDQMASRDFSDSRDRPFRRDDDRRSDRNYDNRDRQERRTEYQGYRADPFQRNAQSRRGFHHHDQMSKSFRNNNQHDDRERRAPSDRRSSFPQRRSSPTVWKHDKFEELEQQEESYMGNNIPELIFFEIMKIF
uniref:Btz domain-containing protein n=1 Tax=Panagrolaimus sp. ES5 TaxID=591445 RepID=A0AC34FPV6_9BILA